MNFKRVPEEQSSQKSGILLYVVGYVSRGYVRTHARVPVLTPWYSLKAVHTFGQRGGGLHPFSPPWPSVGTAFKLYQGVSTGTLAWVLSVSFSSQSWNLPSSIKYNRKVIVIIITVVLVFIIVIVIIVVVFVIVLVMFCAIVAVLE